MDMKQIGKWAYIAGVALAALSALIESLQVEWMATLLVILGIIVGAFHHSADDIVPLGMVYLGLHFAAGSMGSFLDPVGGFVTDIVNAGVGFLGPVVLVTFMIWGFPKLIVKD